MYKNQSFAHGFYSSPLGWLKIIFSSKGLRQIIFLEEKPFAEVSFSDDEAKNLFSDIKKQLDEYFSGNRKDFSLKLDIEGTSFQKDIWKCISKINYGKTDTYLSLAKQAGNPKAIRAAGTACGQNPIPIVIPCHRVKRSDGGLGGYNGGLSRKKVLLELEKAA